MLIKNDLKKITFENGFHTVISEVKIDGTILHENCNTTEDLENYLVDLLTWDGLEICPSTFIVIKNSEDAGSDFCSDLMLPAFWFLDQCNVEWLQSYYGELGLTDRFNVVANIITKYIKNCVVE